MLCCQPNAPERPVADPNRMLLRALAPLVPGLSAPRLSLLRVPGSARKKRLYLAQQVLVAVVAERLVLLHVPKLRALA